MPAKRLALSCAALVALAAPVPETAHARPQYLNEFARKYEHIEFEVRQVKCNTCHCGSKKTVLNNYGTALKDEFKGQKNIKNAVQIDKALSDNEPKSSHIDGKTFGNLIGEGKLPGAPCPDAPKNRSRR